MKGYDSSFLETLKSKNDIVEVVGHYVHLDKKGTNYWGRCPFHHEKTASFSVNSLSQFYYCFGCHKSGDVISFIMEMESLDFGDAVKYLADRVKMPLPSLKIDDEKIKKEKYHKERVLSLLRDCAKYYYSLYRSGNCPLHEEYAKKRGLTDDTLKYFAIGASNSYDGLPSYLKEKGYTFDEMVDSGAVGKSTRNGKDNYYDALANRLIIPVIDSFNNVIAFCGRIIDNRKDVGKYVNTKETIVFTKGKTLFNLNNLKKVKNEEGVNGVIIVEGHMDVISLVQAGVKNVVASMGTALTKDQARIIKRYSDKVFISYDGDFAGQKASIRGLEILKDEGLEVKVVSLPDGLDPDDVVRQKGKDGYLELVNNSMPLIDFKLDILRRTYDVNTVDGKRKYIANAVKVIKESPSASEQEDLLKSVRDLTGVSFDALKRDLYNVEENKPIETAVNKEYVEDMGDKTVLAERFVLASYLFNKPFSTEFSIDELEFTNDIHIEIAEYIKEKLSLNEPVRFTDLYERIEGEEKTELSKIAELEESEHKKFDEAMYFTDCIKTIKSAILTREIDRLSLMFKEEKTADKRKELTKEIAKLMQERNKLI